MTEQNRTARVARLPWRDGDGYSWGGEVILIIGETALQLGSSKEDFQLAMELASAWNARREGGE